MQFFRQDGRGIAFFLKNELFQNAFSKIAKFIYSEKPTKFETNILILFDNI